MWDLNYDHCSMHIKNPKWTIGRWSNDTYDFSVGIGSGRQYVKAGSEHTITNVEGNVYTVTFMSTKKEVVTFTGTQEDLELQGIHYRPEYYLFSECIWTIARLRNVAPRQITYKGLQTLLFRELGYNGAITFIRNFEDFDTYAGNGMRVTCSKLPPTFTPRWWQDWPSGARKPL